MHQVFPFRIVWQYQKRKGCIAVSKLMIEGSHCLEGELTVHGAKNSALPVLSATLLCDGESHIHNCPRLSDVDASVEILRYLGCRVVPVSYTHLQHEAAGPKRQCVDGGSGARVFDG